MTTRRNAGAKFFTVEIERLDLQAEQDDAK